MGPGLFPEGVPKLLGAVLLFLMAAFFIMTPLWILGVVFFALAIYLLWTPKRLLRDDPTRPREND